jgi:hypothetical protein
MDRRNFIQTVSISLAAFTLGSIFKRSQAFAADQVPAGKTVCTDADVVSKALGYVAEAKNIDKTKYPQFKKLAKSHTCLGCALYKEISGGYGQCTMLTNCVVAAKGLCGSWQKKA